MIDIGSLSQDEREELKRALSGRRKRRKTAILKYLSEEQLDQLFAVIKDARDTAIFRVMYHRGLRVSEVGTIQLSDWNRNQDRLRFSRLKGSNGGEYHLTAREVKALKAWLRERGTEPGPLFRSRNGKGISRRMLDVLMKRYGRAAGLPDELCHTHTLKHSCATHLLNRGESIEDVQDHLGHANIANTTLYAQYSSKRREAKDKRLRDW